MLTLRLSMRKCDIKENAEMQACSNLNHYLYSYTIQQTDDHYFLGELNYPPPPQPNSLLLSLKECIFSTLKSLFYCLHISLKNSDCYIVFKRAEI